MLQPGPNTTLSLSARLVLCLGPPSVVAGTAYLSLRTGALSFLALLPSWYGFTSWYRNVKIGGIQRADLEPLVWTYLLSATVGVASVSGMQGVVGYVLSTLFYGTGEARSRFLKEVMRTSVAGLDSETLLYRAATANSLRYRAFVSLFFFTAAGVGEELLKLLPTFYARRRAAKEERKLRKWEYLDYVLSSSLAFGLVEGIGFLYSACETSLETGWKLALTVFERLIIGSSGHILMAVLSALRATRRDYGGERGMSWWKIIGPAAAIHGAFDVGALLFSASEVSIVGSDVWMYFVANDVQGNVGWIHPSDPVTSGLMLTTACCFWGGTAWLVKREFKLLDKGDRKEE